MAKKLQIQEGRLQGPVRITIPAAVAYDLDALQKGIAGLVDRLGCRTCCSGFDITFLQERNFAINEKLEIASSAPNLAFALPQDPVPLRGVTAMLPSKVSYNLEQVQKVVANIADRLGCAACCSGFDITFLHEREFLVDEALNVRPR